MTRRSFFGTAAALAPTFAAPAPGGMPFRQIHLDFHTSELIGDVGAAFNAEEFAATLRDARVNSINVFAKCHHGWAYYDTKIAARHPALKFDLLGEMVRALRREGIAVNYYYSLVWDVLQAARHPEWRAITADGKPVGRPLDDTWPWLCMNTPYLDQVIAENKEILDNYDVHGGWFDILKQPPGGCFCKWCRAERKKLGLSDSAGDTYRHNKLVAMRVEQKLFDLVRAKLPQGAVFFNSRIVIGVRDEMPLFSHIELESLPTGGWGYSHFQQRVRYLRTLGKEVVGMTGRFHKSWGDFGGLKNQAALDYECLNFLANGVKVCVGDQLHPRGRLDAATYLRIGRTYRKVEALEPWCRGAEAAADIGVMSVAATNPDMTTQKVPLVDQGFTNMLLELHQQFNVLDLDSDFTPYKVVILPDEIRPSAALAAKVESYLAGGGALVVSHESLLEPEARRFAIGALGVRYLGPARFRGSYLLIAREHFPNLDDTPYFLYQPGSSVAAEAGVEILATYGFPYFDRSKEQFCSHKQTPLGRRTGEPVITRKGKVVYIANPIFRSYAQDGYGVYKQVVGVLLRQLLPAPLVLAPGLPSTAQVTVLRQGPRHVVHILYYPLTRRAPDIDIIEDPGLLENVELRVRMDRAPARAALVPQNSALPFRHENGYAVCRIPRVLGHQAVSFESSY